MAGSRSEEVYQFVVEFRAQHRVSPTMREIARGVGLSSTSVVDYHVQRLIADGRLEQTLPGRSRALLPTEVRHV